MTEQRAAASSVPEEAVFSLFGRPVRMALSERGFDTPSEPQRRAIPPLVEGEHTLVVAPTGTGKTETAMLPIFDALSQTDPVEGFRCLYITPLRALNRDMRDRLEWWGDHLDLEIDVRHGDTTQYHRQKQADDPPDVLVTTPETLQAMLTGSKLREGLADVSHIVIDEVHELAASKRGAQLTVGLERLRELSGPFQRVGLSATVGDPDEVGRFLTGDRGCEIREVDAGSRLDFDVVTPEITPEDETLASELMTEASMASHVRAIVEIVAENDSTLIFVNTRQTAEALGSRFLALDANIGVHHGSLSRAARVDVEDEFKAGALDALLCTSSMELGIDVGRIDHVVQYGSPREVARLLQRVGRAGHRRELVSSGTIVTGHPDDTLESLAIARRASEGLVEPAQIHDGSLDVVANQTVGLVMDYGEISSQDAFDILRRAYPFRDLDYQEFEAVLEEVSGNRLLWQEPADSDEQTGDGPPVLEKSSGTWQYYYANLSMIPDETTYQVRDLAGGGVVGSLDEKFVVSFAEPGATFIQGGEMWRIAEIDEDDDCVRVSPIEDPAGEVPSWVGQEIPVPSPVAQEVADIQTTTGEQLRESDGAREAAVEIVQERYPTDEFTAQRALEQVERQVEVDEPLPEANQIIVERQANSIVLDAPFGHTTNETLGRLLASLLGQQTGSSIGMEVDPYRIELDTPGGISGGDVRNCLETTDPEHVGPLIRLSLKGSDSLQFTLSQIAATFGALKRYRGSGGLSGNRLQAALEETPIFEESVRELFHERLDVEQAGTVLDQVQDDEIDVVIADGLTPIGVGGQSGGKELLAPENADASVVNAIKERIQGDDVQLVCLHCQDWEREKSVERVRDQPECRNCHSTRVAARSPWADDVLKLIRSEGTDEQAEKTIERAYQNASLVQSHGKKAVLALVARGVGPTNAARIINNHRESAADFYRDILEREREYARTKAFWD